MSALVADVGHRTRVLRALGVTPWQRRRAAGAAISASVDETVGATFPSATCAVLVPKGCTPRELDLLGRVLYAFGADLARAARVEVGDGDLSAVPPARAYLVFGQAQAHALGRALPADAMRSAHIVLADLPADLFDPAAKRRLWHTLRGLRRALATSTAS